MKKYIIIIIAGLNSILALSQKTTKGIKITYEKKSNGTLVENQDFVVFYATEKIGWLTSENRITEKLPTPFEENFIDF
jgi:hypothetical protein